MATLVDNLLRSADTWPDRIAITDGTIRLTYGMLLQHAAAVANRLQAEGCRSGDRVVLVMASGAQFVAAYYGALMAGGIAVLLNPAAKLPDFAAWMEDIEPRFVFVDADNIEARKAAAGLKNAPRVWTSSAEVTGPFGFDKSDALRISSAGAGDPACIMYTSGTTSSPKGVVLSHDNLVANTAAIVEYLKLTHADSIVTVLPFFYSYGSSILHTHIQAGAHVVIQRNFVYPHAVVEALATERATGFAGVPSTFALLLSRVQLAQYDLGGLRYVTQAGGPMPPTLLQRLRATLAHVSVFVMYGQTEATARLTYVPPKELDRKLGSVGIPVRGVRVEIRDEQGRRLQVGQVGDVWVSGPNVMLGYWGNDSATAEVLRDGWLKTGDMGRLDQDGYLFLVGRRSDMIKTGAHRVCPQDVEEAIAELPGVQEVAVVGVNDELLGQSIKAFVVPARDVNLSPMQVKAHCKARLASYKIPKDVELVTSLPRTATGKIRKAELCGR